MPADIPSVSCIIYDLDGTLVDSLPDIAYAVNRLRTSYGLEELAADDIAGFLGDGAPRLLERALYGVVDDPALRPRQRLPKTAVDPGDLLQEFLEIYAEDPAADSQPYPGVLEALRFWRDQGIAQVVLTNKPHPIAVTVCETLGLSGFFDVVIGRGARGDDGAPLAAKPDPAILRHIERQTGAEARDCVMVGDGVADIQFAREAKIPCVVILSGYCAPELLIEQAPDLDLCVTSFAAADALLRSRAGL